MDHYAERNRGMPVWLFVPSTDRDLAGQLEQAKGGAMRDPPAEQQGQRLDSERSADFKASPPPPSYPRRRGCRFESWKSRVGTCRVPFSAHAMVMIQTRDRRFPCDGIAESIAGGWLAGVRIRDAYLPF
jgi:hypothetical protein